MNQSLPALESQSFIPTEIPDRLNTKERLRAAFRWTYEFLLSCEKQDEVRVTVIYGDPGKNPVEKSRDDFRLSFSQEGEHLTVRIVHSGRARSIKGLEIDAVNITDIDVLSEGRNERTIRFKHRADRGSFRFKIAGLDIREISFANVFASTGELEPVGFREPIRPHLFLRGPFPLDELTKTRDLGKVIHDLLNLVYAGAESDDCRIGCFYAHPPDTSLPDVLIPVLTVPRSPIAERARLSAACASGLKEWYSANPARAEGEDKFSFTVSLFRPDEGHALFEVSLLTIPLASLTGLAKA